MSAHTLARVGSRTLNATRSVRPFTVPARSDKPRLVILGSGWGGYGVLRSIDRKRYDVTVVSPSNYFNFTPLLASAAVGTLEFRCATEPVRRFTPEVDYYQAWCDEINFDRKTLTCMPTRTIHVDGARTPGHALHSLNPGQAFSIPYDKLVISVGAYSQTFGIPGVKENAHFLKDVRDSRRIRATIIDCFEQASQPNVTPEERRRLLHFCIVGGGPTGVEFAAELYDFVQKDVARALPNLLPHVRISLYDVAPQILGSFDAKLAKYAEDKFKRRGIDLFTKHHVERVEPQKMYVKESGEVPFGLLVWSTGLAPNPLVASVTGRLKDDKTKSLLTDDHLNVIKPDRTPDRDVWAIGDAARGEGQVLPATAQVANQKARYLVRKLNRMAKGGVPSEPFLYKNQGALAYLGAATAIVDRSQVSGSMKTSPSGVFAWLLWRSAYFTMTLSNRNKVLIPIYWFITMIFGRDLTRF
ncbi:FAD/NAD(P)-binding domain-containing protein [Vararia minispora EC-137]|uniref:FAD/NAD(P)-binding domain-containing protein n=1 Tax=Vararia minispora EC-137 TaxID=1314806 RepID=A0ACB8QVV8_9AGAM|nr:FAD/NAD(P)-binding domain-containing protein [Vararia minispora EC-137]